MFENVHHVGVIYKDISNIVEKIKDIYRMTEVNVETYFVEVNTFIKEITKPLKIKVGYAWFGDSKTMIELFQPLDDNSIYSEYLAKNPEGGIHHVGILVKDIEEETNKWDSKGIKRMVTGITLTNRYVYYDTREMFGYVTELLDDVPQPKMLEEIMKKLKKKE